MARTTSPCFSHRPLWRTTLAVLLALAPFGLAHAQRSIRGRAESRPAAPSPAPAPGRDEPANALPPSQARASEPTEADVAVLRAIAYMFEPAPREVRVLAVGDVALLGDPRALDALAHMILDPDPQVAQAAVEAVTRFRHPRAEQILANVIHHPSLTVGLKLAAVRGLPFQDTPSSRELLTELSNSERQAPPLREAATDMLKQLVTGGGFGLATESTK